MHKHTQYDLSWCLERFYRGFSGPKIHPTATLRHRATTRVPSRWTASAYCDGVASTKRSREPAIAQEPEPFTSDLGCEPATASKPVGILLELDTEELLVDWEASSLVCQPSAGPHPSTPMALSGSSFSPVPPLSSLALSSPQSSGTQALPQLLVTVTPSQSPGSSLSLGFSSSPHLYLFHLGRHLLGVALYIHPGSCLSSAVGHHTPGCLLGNSGLYSTIHSSFNHLLFLRDLICLPDLILLGFLSFVHLVFVIVDF
ncbi:hypothetical protein G5714_022991 [Onychostoma macrolepis]|uniref:Uncharacterized protein n=1 Tax=Onychostoma macrolepis TaxID=369639 RepID=A0A7J6BTM8_9TELE|nr:hypothetical protein G5714_022991 [Onychostoma macrolepis]